MAYLAHSDEKAILADLIIRLCERLCMTVFDPALPLTVLDVGCGEGELTGTVFKRLLALHPDLRLVAVEPAPDMVNACVARLQRDGLWDPNRIHIVRDRFFDHPTGAPPHDAAIFGEPDLILCSHCLYYTDNLPQAIADVRSQLAQPGVALIILQSERSQIYRLCVEHSSSPLLLHGPDRTPLCAERIGAAAARLDFESQLRFPKSHDLYFGILEDILRDGVPRGSWIDCIRATNLSEAAAREFSDMVGVLEFIVHQGLDRMTADRALGYLRAVAREIAGNGEGCGAPHLVLRDSIVGMAHPREVETALEASMAALGPFQKTERLKAAPPRAVSK